MTPARIAVGVARRLPTGIALLPALALLSLTSQAVLPFPARAQDSVRERIDAIRFPEVRFAPPQAHHEEIRGVPVYYVQDGALPLVTFYAAFKGGVRRLSRDYFAAASALPGLMRTGGTAALPPDSVDGRIELLALSMSFGQGGGSVSSWVNTLSDNLDEAASLWTDMLRRPRFDSAQVALWRGAELERVRRRRDDPASLAFGLFNRIMYGSHPVGWQMTPADLKPDDLTGEKLRFVHEAMICPDNMMLGVIGDVDRKRARALVEEMLDGWPPCSGGLREDPVPDIREGPGVFVLHREIQQSVVVLAHATSVRQGDRDAYFASRIGNAILGASGFSSRLVNEVRTRHGLAYTASSLWTVSQKHDGLVGALTRTKPESTLAATRLMLEVIQSMRSAPPFDHEISHAVAEVENGFVFNFQSPFQIVARRMAYRSLGLGEDWLQRYLDGIRQVTPKDVQDVFRKEVDPQQMTILLVGDTARFDGSPSELGTVTVLEEPLPPPEPRPWTPRESPRSRR